MHKHLNDKAQVSLLKNPLKYDSKCLSVHQKYLKSKMFIFDIVRCMHRFFHTCIQFLCIDIRILNFPQILFHNIDYLYEETRNMFLITIQYILSKI